MKHPARLFLVTAILLLAAACSRQQRCTRVMDEAAQHAATAPDSTLLLLDQIASDAAHSTDAGLRARYTLLRAQAAWRCYQDMPPDTALAATVDYYRRPMRQPDLCTAIYYRAMPLYEQGRTTEAATLLTEGVHMAEALADDSLRSKYYESLCMVNEHAKCYEQWLYWAKKFMQHAYHINRVQHVVTALNEMSGAYGCLGRQDSSLVYLLRSLPLLGRTTKAARAMMLANVGCKYLVAHDYAQAEHYLLASIKVVPRANALSALGDVYAARNDTTTADSLWNVAMQTATPQLRLLTLRSVLESHLGNGDAARLRQLYDDIRHLEDSLSAAANTKQIAEIQVSYDRERAVAHYYRLLSAILAVLLLFVVVSVAMWMYYHRKVREYVSAIELNRQEIDRYQRQIEMLKTSGKGHDDEIARLNRRIATLQTDISMRIGRGKEVYETIRENGKLPAADSSSESCLIAYYSVSHYAAYQQWMATYSGLSPRLLTYLILQDMGYDDNQIAAILSVESSTIRSIKSRLKKRQKG